MILINNYEKTIPFLKGLMYSLLCVVAFLYNNILGAVLFAAFIFIYEYIYETKNENLHNGRITFYLMIFLFVALYAFQYLYFNAEANMNIALSELYNN